jgi:hypothetical protein
VSTSNQDIFIACNEGNHGFTLRVDTCSREALITIRDAFKRLEAGEIEALELLSLGNVTSEGIDSFRLQCISAHEAWHRTTLKENCSEYVWFGSREQWSDRAWLLRGLIETNQPAHQYFDYRDDNDVVEIIIAFCEKQ